MTYLFVVAHPDDEVLGAGGFIYQISKLGHKVSVMFLSGEVTARDARPELWELEADINQCATILGIHKIYKASFPNIEFNTVSQLAIVQSIEQVIKECTPEVVITHHPGDLNNDHYHASIACQAAIRLFQRRNDVKPIHEFLYMEILSSTDWALNTSVQPFQPDTFVEIQEEGLAKKMEGLQAYRDVMRDYPHPRSKESIRGLAAYRGSQAGIMFGEAFETVFRRWDLKGTKE